MFSKIQTKKIKKAMAWWIVASFLIFNVASIAVPAAALAASKSSGSKSSSSSSRSSSSSSKSSSSSSKSSSSSSSKSSSSSSASKSSPSLSKNGVSQNSSVGSGKSYNGKATGGTPLPAAGSKTASAAKSSYGSATGSSSKSNTPVKNSNSTNDINKVASKPVQKEKPSIINVLQGIYTTVEGIASKSLTKIVGGVTGAASGAKLGGSKIDAVSKTTEWVNTSVEGWKTYKQAVGRVSTVDTNFPNSSFFGKINGLVANKLVEPVRKIVQPVENGINNSKFGQFSERLFNSTETAVANVNSSVKRSSLFAKATAYTSKAKVLAGNLAEATGLSKLANNKIVNGISKVVNSNTLKAVVESPVFKVAGKAIAVLAIGQGINDYVNAKNGYDKASAVLNGLSGALALAAPATGVAAPIVAGAAVVLGVTSVALKNKTVQKGLNWVGAKSVAAYNATKAAVKNTYNNAKAAVASTYNNAKTAVKNTYNNAKAAVASTYNNAKTAVKNTYNNAKAVVASTYNNTKTAVKNTYNNAKAAVTSTYNNAKTAVKNTYNNTVAAVKNSYSNVTKVASNFGSSFSRGWKSIFG